MKSSSPRAACGRFASAWRNSGAQRCAERPLRSAPLLRGVHKRIGGEWRGRCALTTRRCGNLLGACSPVPGGPQELARSIDRRHCAREGTPPTRTLRHSCAIRDTYTRSVCIPKLRNRQCADCAKRSFHNSRSLRENILWHYAIKKEMITRID
jgi:hypothetical protein